MQGRPSSTTTIFNQLNSSTKNFLGGLLLLSLPGVTIAGTTHTQNTVPKLDSIYFYDPSRTSMYQLIVNSNGYARDMIELIRDGLCGADATGSFPVVNFEKIGEWGWNNLATLLGAVNQQVETGFLQCLFDTIETRAERQEEHAQNVGKIIGLLILGFVILGACAIAACCFYNRYETHKWQQEQERYRQANLETKKLLGQMEEEQVPTYGTYRPV